MQTHQPKPSTQTLRRWRNIIFINNNPIGKTHDSPPPPGTVLQMDLAEAIQALTEALDAALDEARQDTTFRAANIFE